MTQPALPPGAIVAEKAPPPFSLLDYEGNLRADADPSLVPDLSDADCLRLYREFIKLRLVDDRYLKLQRQGRLGFYMQSTGEEATQLGVASPQTRPSARRVTPRDTKAPAVWAAPRTVEVPDETMALMPAPGEHKREELLEALERKVAQIEGMQAQLAHSKAQLLGVIEAVRAQPQGVPCSMGQKQVLASIKLQP